MIFLGDFVRIIKDDIHKGFCGTVQAYDGHRFYTIELLNMNRTCLCLEGEIEKLSEHEKNNIKEQITSPKRVKPNVQIKLGTRNSEKFYKKLHQNQNSDDLNDPKIVIININPENINNCVEHVIHGAREGTPAAGNVNRLTRGDICLIRKTSGGGTRKYGVLGIWYYYGKQNIEDFPEPLWDPIAGWKWKIIMKPLVKEFETLFEEDFSIAVPGQLRHKESSKVYGLKQTGIQGAVTIPRDPSLLRRYLKAIIEEKKDECDLEVEYEDESGNIFNINVYEFLDDLTKENFL